LKDQIADELPVIGQNIVFKPGGPSLIHIIATRNPDGIKVWLSINLQPQIRIYSGCRQYGDCCKIDSFI